VIGFSISSAAAGSARIKYKVIANAPIWIKPTYIAASGVHLTIAKGRKLLIVNHSAENPRI